MSFGQSIASKVTTTTISGLGSIISPYAGMVVSITDYGGTIAVYDGARWRLNPLIIPFASRPAANAVPEGCGLFATDLNRAEFISDGTNWRPRGVQDIYHKNGLISSPLATLTGVTSGAFAIPQIKIPAGMIIPNSKLTVQTSERKTGANGTYSFVITHGANGSLVTDPAICNASVAATSLIDVVAQAGMKYASSRTAYLQQNYIGEGATNYTSASLQAERSASPNIDQYITIGVTSANALDSFALHHVRVTYEA